MENIPSSFRAKLVFELLKEGTFYWNIKNDLSTPNNLQKRKSGLLIALQVMCFDVRELALLLLLISINTPECQRAHTFICGGEAKGQRSASDDQRLVAEPSDVSRIKTIKTWRTWAGDCLIRISARNGSTIWNVST